MPTPKIDTGYQPGTYPDPSEGFFGYPAGTATRQDPYPYGSYPVPDDAVPCSNPTGCPVGIVIDVTGGPTTYTFITSDVPGHTTVWDFGDGSPRVSVPSDQSVDHTYAAAGDFTVTAICHQQVATQVITAGAGTAAVTIPIKLSGGKWLAQWDDAALRPLGTHTFKAQFTIDAGTNSDIRVWTSDLDTALNYLDIYSTTPAPDGLLSYRVGNPYAMGDSKIQAIATTPTLSPVYDVTFHLSGDAGSAPDWGDWLSVDGIHNELAITDPTYAVPWVALVASDQVQPANWRDGSPHPIAISTDSTGLTSAPLSWAYGYVADNVTKMTTMPTDYSSSNLFPAIGANPVLHMEMKAMLGKTANIAYTGAGATGKWRLQALAYFVLTPNYSGGCGLSDTLTGWNRTVGSSFTGTALLPPGLAAGNFTTPACFQQRGTNTAATRLYKPGGTVQLTGAELFALAGQSVTVQNVAGKFTVISP